MAGCLVQINSVFKKLRGACARSLFHPHGFASSGVKFAAKFANCTVAAARGAMAAPVENHAQVQRVPAFRREEFFQITFGLLDIASVAQPPARGQSVDVRIHREGRHAEGL